MMCDLSPIARHCGISTHTCYNLKGNGLRGENSTYCLPFTGLTQIQEGRGEEEEDEEDVVIRRVLRGKYYIEKQGEQKERRDGEHSVLQ